MEPLDSTNPCTDELRDRSATAAEGDDMVVDRANSKDSMFELSALEQIRSLGQPSLVEKVVQTFLDSTKDRIQTLSAAAQSSDLKTVGFEAHTIKSSAASIGGVGLSELCQSIETVASSIEGQKGSSELAALTNRVQPAFDALEARLQTVITQSAGD